MLLNQCFESAIFWVFGLDFNPLEMTNQVLEPIHSLISAIVVDDTQNLIIDKHEYLEWNALLEFHSLESAIWVLGLDFSPLEMSNHIIESVHSLISAIIVDVIPARLNSSCWYNY